MPQGKCLGCGEYHDWDATPNSRMAGNGCPFCSGRNKCSCGSADKVPRLAAWWHPTLNGSLKLADITPHAPTEYTWCCPKSVCKHPHIFRARPRGGDIGCPYCSNRVVCLCNSLSTLHFETAQLWHPELNGDLSPDSFGPGSEKEVWWQHKCPCACLQEWRESILNCVGRSKGCPWCSGRAVCPHKSLEAYYPALAAEWHPDNLLLPSQVSRCSGEKVKHHHRDLDNCPPCLLLPVSTLEDLLKLQSVLEVNSQVL